MALRRFRMLVSVPLAVGAVLATSYVAQSATQAPQTVQGPKFESDLMWPQVLPRHQILGSVTGLAIDSRDHVMIVHLTGPSTSPGGSIIVRTEGGATSTPPFGECCAAAADFLEFDADGKLVAQWTGPGAGREWPERVTGLGVDKAGNVWVGGAGGNDTRIFKFARDGKLMLAIGKVGAAAAPPPAPTAPDTAYMGVSRGAAATGAAGGAAAAAGAGGRGGGGRGAGGGGRGGGGGGGGLPANSTATDAFGGATAFAFDDAANEVYVADGSRNHRVAVLDMNTGAIKRSWGAYGKPPTDGPATSYSATAAQFGNPISCVEISADNMVYVCDQKNNRIQVFQKNGTFVKEAQVAPNTKGPGAVWDIAFSRDGAQQYLYVADGQNEKIHILNRQTLAEIADFGDGGRQAGKWIGLAGVVTDSKGNLITSETAQGKRIQKFVFKGVTQIPKSQLVVWPKGAP